MRVLVTGGTGTVGASISKKFVANGWDVRVIGAEPTCDIEGITYTQLDIRDYDAVLEQVDGCDAIVHLAAIPNTLLAPAQDIFHINVSGTYNVFEAASKTGVKRIAQASSINALGSYWGYDDRQFEYFPLDENHNLFTTDVYSFSKQMVEEIADHFWRRDGIVSASFRLPAVWSDSVIGSRDLRTHLPIKRDEMVAFLELPEVEQQRQLASVRQEVLDYRARRLYDYAARQAGLDQGQGDFDNPLWSAYFFDRFNYWSYIHTDDSTQAFEKAITADYVGSHPLFVTSAENYLQVNSEALLHVFFPDVTRRIRPIEGAGSLISYDRATSLIDFVSRWTFNFL